MATAKNTWENRESEKRLFDEKVRRLDAQVKSFGAARSPLTLSIDAERIVAAGDQIYAIPNDWGFRDFMLSYGLDRLGRAIVDAEPDRNNPRHPIAAALLTSSAYAVDGENGKMRLIGTDPGLFGFLKISYDLFTVADNAHLQEEMIKRLKQNDQNFRGARYELFVAASLIRAGFSVEFENESDSSKSHCEFTAKDKLSGKAFSVEAKCRNHSGERKGAKVYRLLQKALQKDADHERIIFLDVNMRPDTKPLFKEPWQKEIMETVSELERAQKRERPWPQAIVFFTNRLLPGWEHEIEGTGTTLLTAINHPLFMTNDRRAVEATYPEIGKLFGAVQDKANPPEHFFGQ
ncbi:MAG: hypothetical protein CL534_23560 [Ahrensia sp.]|nr:hypothetical protein [Ahrensia sp.]